MAGAQPQDAIRKSPGTIWSLFLARFFFQLIEISSHLFGLISKGARRCVGGSHHLVAENHQVRSKSTMRPQSAHAGTQTCSGHRIENK